MTIPVLVIEDEKSHFDQISNKLAGRGYSCTNINGPHGELVASYKTKYRDNQIVIVDLNLKGASSFDWQAGFTFIRDTLWPIDRNTVFIAFSRHLSDKISIPRRLGDDQPRLIPLAKEPAEDDSTRLNEACLNQLAAVVDSCRDTTVSFFSVPQQQTARYSEPFAEFLESRPRARHKIVNDLMFRSVMTLNALSIACSQFARAGYQAHRYAVGVYGSCGRLEMRSDSDVELSVWVNAEPSIALAHDRREAYGFLAASYWNRSTAVCGELDPAVDWEGSKDFPHGLLARDVGDDGIAENKFIPVMFINDLVDGAPDRPGINNRLLQFLTEVKPVFNSELIDTTKQKLLRTFMNDSKSPAALLKASIWDEMIDDFWKSTKPGDLRSPKERKRFCYRVLNLFALRLCFIRLIEFNGGVLLETDGEWQTLFDELSEAGVLKVIRFALAYQAALLAAKLPKDSISLLCEEVVELYSDVLSQFVSGPVVVADMRALVSKFGELIGACQECEHLRSVHSVGWLTRVERERDWFNAI